jgi:hypothetical protein
MNINRDNYETYFLLYVDNELSAEQKHLVDLFVTENPDLGRELSDLLDTKLQKEAFIFNDKEKLLRTGSGASLLEENLFLLLDDELTSAESTALLQRIDEDQAVKKNWNLIRQTKLDNAENIIFPDRQNLYRYEKTPIIHLRYWKVAVAAAIIGIGLFLGISLFSSNDENKIEVAKTKTDTQYPVKKDIDKKERPVQLVAENEDEPRRRAGKITDELATPEQKKPDHKVTEQSTARGKNDRKNEPNGVEESLSKNINTKQSNKSIPETVLPANKEMAVKDPENKLSRQNREAIIATIDKKDPVEANLANTMALVQTEKEADKVLFMDEDKLTRSRVGGVFRKLRRVIARNTNIRINDHIKLGDFEIAIK